MDDLFNAVRQTETLGPDAVFLPGRALDQERDLVETIETIAAFSPLRRLQTPGGRQFSVRMTNCGELGWHSDRGGYRYESVDPLTGRKWPGLPREWSRLARDLAREAGFDGFTPQACLINCYEPGARMGLHQDRDEEALESPIVSISLGVPALFLFGGVAKTDAVRKIPLLSGDVVVWGGRSRLFYHGIAPLKPGTHPLTGALRWNLTLRRVRAQDSP